jgi:hypothetical protein
LSHQTRCLTCDNLSSVEESFFNLSLDITHNVSLPYCLRQFLTPELLSGSNKFFCDRCHSLQEASRCIRVKRAPQNLIIQLKRFKFNEKAQQLDKVSHRIYFGSELRLDDLPHLLYQLYAVVVHLGHGPDTGHYICISRQADPNNSPNWVLFDDHTARPFRFEQMEALFGAVAAMQSSSCGYLLFYSSKLPSSRKLPSSSSRRSRTPVDPTQVEPSELAPTQVESSTQIEPSELAPTQVEPADLVPTQVEPADLAPTQVEPADLVPTSVKTPSDAPPSQAET